MTTTQLFSGSIPENYDQYLGPYLFEPYAMDFAQRLKTEKCERVLEVACGTGRVTAHIAEFLEEGGELIATDINNDMMEIAKAKVYDKRVRWQVADGQELPFSNDTFDHVICQFGVMFFPDKPKAFEETYRVLAKDGKYIFSTWASLDDNKWTQVVKDVLEDVFRDETPDFLQKGPYSFNDTGLIEKLLANAGFKHIAIEPVQKTVTYESVDAFIKGFFEGTPLNIFFQKRDDTLRQLVKQKLKQSLQQQFGDDVESQMLAYICTSTKE